MSGVFSPTDLAELRAWNTQTNSDACTIKRPSGRTLNPLTLVDEPGAGTVIYTGGCQFKEPQDSTMQVIGDGQVTLQNIDVFINHGADRVRKGDILTVDQADEPDWIGRDLVVLDARLQTQPRGRKLTCTFIEPSGTHDPSE